MNFLLKQRLIGAIVLVALGVIFIPMFLEGPKEPVVPDMQSVPRQEIMPPAGESQGFAETEKVLPLPPMSVINQPQPEKKEPEQNQQKRAAEKKLEETGQNKPVAPETKPKVKSEQPPKTAPVKSATSTIKTETKPADPSADKLGSWIIQAGSFSSQKNAFALRDKLRKAGYVTQVERVVIGKGETYRVRIGPYLDRDKAESNIDKLNKAFQLNSRVMSYP